jgi:molybdopterin synthase catalytic subunit
MKKPKKVFIDGPISPEFVAHSIQKHQSKTSIGAHSLFLGQIRADEVDGKVVKGIEYTAYEDMANKVFHEIREATFEKYDLSCMHIYHSLGFVPTGENSLFVFVSAPHRTIVFEALAWLVQEIKDKAPVFGKELFEDDSHQWKTNL